MNNTSIQFDYDEQRPAPPAKLTCVDGGDKMTGRGLTDLFLSLQRLFWNHTRITRELSPVISISWSLVAVSGRGQTA